MLDYRTGPGVREQGGRLIAASNANSLLVDCSAVDESSSVGLSLLLAFMRDAGKAGKTLQVRGMPEDMRKIAQMGGLLEIIPLHD